MASDTVMLKKPYPEWGLQVRIPVLAHAGVSGIVIGTDCFIRGCDDETRATVYAH